MNKKIILLILLISGIISVLLLMQKSPSEKKPLFSQQELEKKKLKEAKAEFNIERLKYEFDMVKHPITGKIPEGIFEMELAQAKTIPTKENYSTTIATENTLSTTLLNNYIPAGPNNIGGRTRAVAHDIRYGSSNQVIIAGCVSGGIMRSADGGNSWILVTPPEDVHTFTTVAQDPRPGFQDTWYAGGGELWGNSASEIGAIYWGFGIWKSTNNGITWTKTTFLVNDFTGNIGQGSLEAFDHPFDLTYRIRINPTNGHVYVACHRRIVRSTTNGSSWETVFGSTVNTNASQGQTDVAITADGKILAAMNGGNPDVGLRGVFISSTGNRGSFQRIAGGQTIGVDSVTGWRANSPFNQGRRIIMDLAPSNTNIGYVFYENGLSNDPPNLKPEADLFKFELSANTAIWSNRSDNMPDYPVGNLSSSDPLAVQGGYDMEVKVYPTNPNIVFIGGVNLYRSTDGFTSNTNTAWINGYTQVPLDYNLYPNGHPDIHALDFNPSNPAEVICGDDGGVRRTANILAGGNNWPLHPVTWSFLNNYQTVQYYHVAIDPGTDRNNFAGGTQDNGTLLRDKLGITGLPLADSNRHVRLVGGDGTMVGISDLNTSIQAQYVYGASQYGNIRRIRISPTRQVDAIRPSNLTTAFVGATTEFGEFVTNFRLNQDNTEDLYYVNFNRLFRTTAASAVNAGGWTELVGVSQAVNPFDVNGRGIRIRAITFSRGLYTTSHAMYIGTTPDLITGNLQGRIFRLDDPRNSLPTNIPVDITPAGLVGNVQSIAVNPNNDDEIIAVVSNYGAVGVWHTTNAKSANPIWKNVEGNLTLPSFRSAAIIVKKEANNNPVTEYYVGTSIGLYSTASLSGSPTWVREGGQTLNYAVISSLSYRPTDNILLVGTHGNGMYYTSVGTPNYTPNLNTAINPVINDKNFIRGIYPTVANNKIQFQVGNLYSVKRLNVQVTSANGQVVLRKEMPYQNNNLDLTGMSPGAYIISIYSNDGKYRHIQKLIKR